jgi:hypothetical protein
MGMKPRFSNFEVSHLVRVSLGKEFQGFPGVVTANSYRVFIQEKLYRGTSTNGSSS